MDATRIYFTFFAETDDPKGLMDKIIKENPCISFMTGDKIIWKKDETSTS